MPSIVIPDDYPIVMAVSRAYGQLLEKTPVEYFETLPGTEDALIERIRNFEIVINIRSSSKFTRRLFACCPRLKLLSIWGTGTDNVDLVAAQQQAVTVTNTPGVSAVSIAEHALMLTLAVARRVVAIHNGVVAGTWPRGQSMQLHGKTLGVIRLGAIEASSRGWLRVLACGSSPGRCTPILPWDLSIWISGSCSESATLSVCTYGSLPKPRGF
jgi:phosphoglycerate dehydrogenase-like enzyme